MTVFEKIEQVLIRNWVEIINPVELKKLILETTKVTNFNVEVSQGCVVQPTKFNITHFEPKHNSSYELWLEFTSPKEDGYVIGTYVAILSLDGSIKVIESYGVFFKP